MAIGFELRVCRLIDIGPQTHQLVEFVPLWRTTGWTHFDFHPLRARVRLSSNGSAMLEISCDTTVEYRYSLPAFHDSSRTTSKNVIFGLHLYGCACTLQFSSEKKKKKRLHPTRIVPLSRSPLPLFTNFTVDSRSICRGKRAISQ